MIDPFLIKKSSTVYDAIVVGSGISGGWVAKELCEKGLKVLLVERGRPVHHQKDYIHEGKALWELPHRGQVDYQLVEDQYSTARKCYAFNDATKHFFPNEKEAPYQTAEGTSFDWIRGHQLGGRSLLWHRQSFRLSDYDFQENLIDGHGTDWPIRYKDIEAWYTHVEKFVGISANRDNIATLPDSECLPAFEFNAVERHAQKKIAEKYKDRRLVQGRCAHLSEPTQFFLDQGRHKCMARNQCQRGCSFGAYFSTLSSTLPAAIKTNNLHIACHSVVHSVIYDKASNRASGVNVIDEQTLETREYKANMVFLCASTIGTTQIMLNSVSESFPDGIANSSGTLGHYLMDHIYNSSAGGVMEGFEDDYYKGQRPTGPIVPRWVNLGKQTEKFSRGYFLRGNAIRNSVTYMLDDNSFGEEFKARMRKPGPWYFHLGSSGEMQPKFENAVSLHPKLKDKWGIPQVVINCKWGDNDRMMMEAMADACAEVLEAVGAKHVTRSITDAPPGLAIHEMGTARMGRDPKTSVLNGNNQCHDIPNLFVTDGACMASSAHQNPSLTYMALSARAANFAVEKYKRKEL